MAVNERLRLRRDELNAYIEALHKRYVNGWTPYLALGIALKAAESPALNLAWRERDAHDAQTLHNLEELASELGLVFASVERQPVLDIVDVADWSTGWQESLLTAAQSLKDAAVSVTTAVQAYLASLGLDTQNRRVQWNEDLICADLAFTRRKHGKPIASVKMV